MKTLYRNTDKALKVLARKAGFKFNNTNFGDWLSDYTYYFEGDVCTVRAVDTLLSSINSTDVDSLFVFRQQINELI